MQLNPNLHCYHTQAKQQQQQQQHCQVQCFPFRYFFFFLSTFVICTWYIEFYARTKLHTHTTQFSLVPSALVHTYCFCRFSCGVYFLFFSIYKIQRWRMELVFVHTFMYTYCYSLIQSTHSGCQHTHVLCIVLHTCLVPFTCTKHAFSIFPFNFSSSSSSPRLFFHIHNFPSECHCVCERERARALCVRAAFKRIFGKNQIQQ